MDQEAAKRGGKADIHPEGDEGEGSEGAGVGGDSEGVEARSGMGEDVGEGIYIAPQEDDEEETE